MDVAVGVDFLSVQILHDFHRTLAENVLLKDVAQRGLGIDGKDQDFVSLLRQPEGCGCGKSGFSQSTLAAEHDVTPFFILFKRFS